MPAPAAMPTRPKCAPADDLLTELTVSPPLGTQSRDIVKTLFGEPVLARWLEPEGDQRLCTLAIMWGVCLSSGSLWLRPCGEHGYPQHSRKWGVTL